MLEFDCNAYGKFFTDDLNVGEEFTYSTLRNNSNRDKVEMVCKVLPYRYSDCNSCSLRDYYCNGIHCNIKVLKIKQI